MYLIRERLAATGCSTSPYDDLTTGIPAGLLDIERDRVTYLSKQIIQLQPGIRKIYRVISFFYLLFTRVLTFDTV